MTNIMTFHPYINFPFIRGNIPSANGVLISLAWACRNYADFLYRIILLPIALRKQGYVATRLKSLLLNFDGCHNKFVVRYSVSICTMKMDWSTYHTIPFLIRLPRTWFLWATRQLFLEIQRTIILPVHLVHASNFQ